MSGKVAQARINTTKYTVELTPYEYSILNKNHLISTVCKKQLASAVTLQDDQEEVIELSMTLAELVLEAHPGLTREAIQASLAFDKDFGELAFRAKLPATSGIVLFRISAPSSAHIADR